MDQGALIITGAARQVHLSWCARQGLAVRGTTGMIETHWKLSAGRVKAARTMTGRAGSRRTVKQATAHMSRLYNVHLIVGVGPTVQA